MKRLFRFTHYRCVAVWLFGAVWLASGSLGATEDAFSDPAASSQALPAFQTLSTIHPTAFPDGSIRAVCPALSSIEAMVGFAPAILTMRVRSLGAVDLCNVVTSCQRCVAHAARQGPLVEAGSNSGWDRSTARTNSIFGSRTSRGSPSGQAGLGDPGLPATRPLLAGTFGPPGPPFPRETTIGTQVIFKAVDSRLVPTTRRLCTRPPPRLAAPRATAPRVHSHHSTKQPPLHNVKETT